MFVGLIIISKGNASLDKGLDVFRVISTIIDKAMTYETLANHGFSSPRDILSAATKQYAWIINPTTSLDPARFLFQWLAVSLTEIPLLVYQSPTESATLEDLFQVG